MAGSFIFWKKLIVRLRRSLGPESRNYQKKIDNALLNTEQASQTYSALLNRGFSKEAILQDLMQENPLMTMLKAEDNLKGVPDRFKEPLELAPEVKCVTVANPIPQEMAATITMDGARIAKFDTDRCHEILTRTMAENKIWFYDPQADEPLPGHLEKAMRQMGPAQYLQWICKNYRVNISPVPQDEHQATRSVRIAVRTLKDFDGERFHQ